MSRNERRVENRKKAMESVAKKFRGMGKSGHPAWNVTVPRKVARRIAFNLARKGETL